MSSIEKLRIKLEVLDGDPTPGQLLHLIEDLVDILEEKTKIGFKHEGK